MVWYTPLYLEINSFHIYGNYFNFWGKIPFLGKKMRDQCVNIIGTVFCMYFLPPLATTIPMILLKQDFSDYTRQHGNPCTTRLVLDDHRKCVHTCEQWFGFKQRMLTQDSAVGYWKTWSNAVVLFFKTSQRFDSRISCYQSQV